MYPPSPSKIVSRHRWNLIFILEMEIGIDRCEGTKVENLDVYWWEKIEVEVKRMIDEKEK